MMKKFLFLTIVFLFFPLTIFAERDLSQELFGRILLQVESYGRAWYIYPENHKRYYLKDGETAYKLMRDLSLGITNKDLEKIPVKKEDYADDKLIKRLIGRILLQVEEHGEAWYLNPTDGLRYYLKDGNAAFEIMRGLSLGISNKDLAKIPVNEKQVVADYTFNQAVYAKLDQAGQLISGYYSDKILPLASLTKLMTALVLLDLNPRWDREITISSTQINYPKTLVGDDLTSEIDLQAGDKIVFRDLWNAMLIASSNQATVALVESTGLMRHDFVYLMNQKAKELGLLKTLFFDATGLDAHNVSTPYETAILAKVAFSKPEIGQNSKLTDYVIKLPEREIKLMNRNYSLLELNPDAVKTGFLIEAQRNVALKKGEDIIVVMHALSAKERNDIINKLLFNS